MPTFYVRLRTSIIATALVSIFGAGAAAQDADAVCWQPAYLDCVAGNPGASPGCYGNYKKCMTAAAMAVPTCWNAAFTDCVGATNTSVAGVTGCHNNYLGCLANTSTRSPSSQQEIASRYAPMIWLAQGEQWLPSSIDFFAANVQAKCNGQVVNQDILTLAASQLPSGGGTDTTCNFLTRQPLSGPYDRPAFLQGQSPAQTSVPIYIFLYSDSSESGVFYAQYMTFYPYNFGKSACMTLAPFDNCLGSRVEMGDHVADWELMTIRFSQGQPSAVHVGSHGNDLPDTAWNFFPPTWTKGADSGTGPALQWEGTHPVVYSAAGSHGIYGWEGKQNYRTLPTGDELNDYTSRGIRWETWNNIVWSDDPRYNVLLNIYNGRWGNLHMGKNACEISPVLATLCGPAGIPTNEYQLNDGPSLPNRQRDKNEIHPF